MAQKNEKKEILDDNSYENSLFRNVIESKKYKLATLVVCYILVLTIITLIANTNQQIMYNNILIREILTEGAITKETMLSMNFIFWMAYLN